MKKTLYLFIDESGNFDFSSSGTKHFVLTCLKTSTPYIDRNKLLRLKYKLLSSDINQEFFHATEDKQIVRNLVFKLIKSLRDDTNSYSLVIKKENIKKSLHDPLKFYELVCLNLVRNVLSKSKADEYRKVVIILGSIFIKNKQSSILKTLKQYLKSNFSIPFGIYFHKSQSDLNSQLADYFGWAVYVKFERNELRPINEIKSKIKTTNPSILSEEPGGSC